MVTAPAAWNLDLDPLPQQPGASPGISKNGLPFTLVLHTLICSGDGSVIFTVRLREWQRMRPTDANELTGAARILKLSLTDNSGTGEPWLP